MDNHNMIIGIGIVLILAGGIPAAVGTTSSALFLLYGAMLVAGVLLVAWGKKQAEKAQNKR